MAKAEVYVWQIGQEGLPMLVILKPWRIPYPIFQPQSPQQLYVREGTLPPASQEAETLCLLPPPLWQEGNCLLNLLFVKALQVGVEVEGFQDFLSFRRLIV